MWPVIKARSTFRNARHIKVMFHLLTAGIPAHDVILVIYIMRFEHLCKHLPEEHFKWMTFSHCCKFQTKYSKKFKLLLKVKWWVTFYFDTKQFFQWFSLVSVVTVT